MNTKLLFAMLTATVLTSTSTIAEPSVANNGFTQTIQITNLLANTDLQDPGMTQTAILVSYYSGGTSACWSTSIDYQSDSTAYAGPGLGCANKINQVVVSAVPVRGKTPTYTSPYTVTIDPSKFVTQIIITQEQAPQFDPQTGLIKYPGTMRAKMQAMMH